MTILQPYAEIGPRLEPIKQRLDVDRADLINQYHQALREALFTHRREVRPSILGRIASAEAEALLTFFQHPDPAAALERGEQLCRIGLSGESVLRLGQITRRFCLDHLPEDLHFLALETVEAYHSAVIQGYIHERKTITLEEQERIRSALQRTLSRYAVQMEVAADVARAATSILDLNQLLQTTVERIRERFGLYYVGIFLVDKDNRWAILQASAGEAGQVLLRRGYRLKVGGDSMVGWCVAHGEARIALDVGEAAISFDISLMADVHSEMAIPLISRGKVIGAMAVQSRRVAAFSDQDLAVIRITADQLANAIENARLFQERERRITELATLNEMGQALSAALELGELLEMVHHQVSRIFDTTNFSIVTFEEGSDEWTLAFNLEHNRPQSATSHKIGADLISYIIRSRQSVLLSNYRERHAFLEQQRVKPLGKHVKSWMGVPLIANDRVVGVMAIQSYRQEDLYTDHDLAIFSTIGAQAAIAIENARLYQQVRLELTERKRAAEELLIAKDAAEAANRAKSRFLATMSHELRTPLSAIIGFSELLLMEAELLGYTKLGSDLAKIRAAGKHLLALITDILDLSKIEANKIELDLETFDITPLIHDVVTTVQPLIEKNVNTLKVDCPSDVGAMYSDQTKVRQALYNLLSNAAKFTQHGTITLTVGEQRSAGAAWITFQVADTGIGMTNEQMQQLFKEFTQVDASTTRKYGGTGLGLALSRRYCQMLGGDISVESELGRGSTFTIRLPATLAEPRVVSSSPALETPVQIE
jgi:signal transduction histidine kinase